MSGSGKNDIDSLLESMFRGGRLNLKKAETAGKAADYTGDAISDSLGKSLEQLTKETQASLADLDHQLKQDGMESSSAGNGGNAADLDAAFARARQEAGEQVLGQEEFLSALTIAFKRPFVAGNGGNVPLGRCLVLGKSGTGRHTALTVLAGSLARQGVLKSPKLAFLDLDRYGEPGSEKLFLQDLYAALKSGVCGLVFENYEGCHPSILPLISALFRQGEAPLSGRYAEQKGMLVEIGSALVPGAVSTLSVARKYLFLLTDRDESKLADAFGMPFLSAMDDLCETRPFAPEALAAVSERLLEKLCQRVKNKLGFSVTWEASAVQTLVAACPPGQGVLPLAEETDRLYRLFSEAKLKQGLENLTGEISGEQGRLVARCEQAGHVLVLESAEDGAAVREKAVQDIKQELSEIVGLRKVKEYILSLEDNFKIQQLRREKGLKTESPSMHCIFTGNPGTGKTTMARIFSRYLKAIGVLAGGQLIEVSRADLVGRYVGHTAPLTQKAVQSALGGVLFIDEAYSLFRGKDDSFGLEAIDTLVKEMEDHRDDLVVVLAGYSREMEEFLTANSGLRSRFPNVIEFPDYTAGELLEITKSIVKGKGYRLDPACCQPLEAYYEAMQQEGDPRTNGNGRMARNKVEEAVLNCSRRNLNTPEDQRDLELLLPEDFSLL